MLRDDMLQRPLVFHTFALAVILTLLGGAPSVTMQQMLRRGANQPQIDMAGYAPNDHHLSVWRRLSDMLGPWQTALSPTWAELPEDSGHFSWALR